MKFVNNILAMTFLLFFISCSAWPALVPIPTGKTKKEAYIIPLAAAASQPVTATVRITGPLDAADKSKRGVVGNGGLKFLETMQLGTIDKNSVDTTASSTWVSGDLTIATINASGLVTATSKAGTSKITATNSGSTASITVHVNTNGTVAPSIVAFDGKNFIQLSEAISTNSTEEK